MKAAAFRYVAAGSAANAASLLAEHGDAAKILAGGQSLVPLMNLRLAQPELLVDIAGAGLNEVRLNGSLELDVMVTQNTALASREVVSAAPLLTRALADVGHHTLRNRGTVGGSVAHADPAAEIPAVVLALDGQIVVVGPDGTERVVPAEQFFVAQYETVLADDEVLTTIRLPAAGHADAWAFYEVARRRGDYALAGVAAALTLGADDSVAGARVVVFGVAARPVLIRECEAILRGRPLGEAESAAAAAGAAAEAIEPVGDIHGTAGYRRRIVEVAVRRALIAAQRSGR